MGWANDAFARDLARAEIYPISSGKDLDSSCKKQEEMNEPDGNYGLKYKGTTVNFRYAYIDLLMEMRAKVKSRELYVPEGKIDLCLKKLDEWILYRGGTIDEKAEWDDKEKPRTIHTCASEAICYLNYIREKRRINNSDYWYLHSLIAKISILDDKLRR